MYPYRRMYFFYVASARRMRASTSSDIHMASNSNATERRWIATSACKQPKRAAAIATGASIPISASFRSKALLRILSCNHDHHRALPVVFEQEM